MTNPYLASLREKYKGLKAGIEGLQNRAADANRELTDDEFRSVQEQGAEAQKIYTQIKDLTEVEQRDRAVAELAASLDTDTEVDRDKVRDARNASNTTATDRDPGHYRSEKNGGKQSFFADMYRAKSGSDDEASRRLLEHSRALSTGAQGPGLVAPKWLTEEFESLARQGRALANAVRNIPLGDDPRPMTLPKQTAGVTSASVAEQATENTALANVDEYDTDVDTVTPKPTAGKQDVSRQMLDMSSPAVDLLIYGDLMEEYNFQVEGKVGTAIKAAGVALTAIATETAFDTGSAGVDSVVDLAIGVRKARKLPANILAMTIERYGEFLKLKGSDGRPLIAEETAGQAMNVVGVGTVAVDGRVRGLGIIATEGMGTGAYPDTYAAIRASDTLLFESNVMRFRFEEIAGPQSIRLGIWGYTAVIVRQGTRSVRRINVTAGT